MVPYLNSIHLTLDSWQPHQDSDGWKFASTDPGRALIEYHNNLSPFPAGAPRYVIPVPQLLADIEALVILFQPSTPPLWHARPSSSAVVLYGFGNASGSSFGTSLLINDTLHYRHGQWSTEHAENSLNYCELRNLVYAIEEATAKGLLQGGELFMFTDNSATESTFHHGTSSSKSLFQLVLRL
jgi:hypothetical protein